MKKKDNLKVKEDYLQKIKLINKYNKYYYSESSPLVDDSTYDKIKHEILNLEKKYSFLKFFEGLKPTDKDGESLLFKNEYFFSRDKT